LVEGVSTFCKTNPNFFKMINASAAGSGSHVVHGSNSGSDNGNNGFGNDGGNKENID
jgi:hypothetical protein